MGVALEDRQAVEVRTNAANQHVIAVVQQVMSGNGCADVGRGLVDELHRVRGGDVLKHDFQCWETLYNAAHVLVDEDLFAVKDVYASAGDFTVDQQRHADFSHDLQNREDRIDAGYTGVGVGRCPCRIQLGSMDESAGLGRANVFWLGTVGEVQHHQRLEAAAGGAGSQDALAISVGLGSITHRRYQVWHDDGAAKSARYIRDSVRQHGTIAKMYMPVVGTQQGQAVRHWGFQAGRTEVNATGKDSVRHSLSSFVIADR